MKSIAAVFNRFIGKKSVDIRWINDFFLPVSGIEKYLEVLMERYELIE